MIVDGVDDFLSCGIDFVTLLGLGALYLGLRLELRAHLLSRSVVLCGLPGRALLSCLLISDGGLRGRRLCVDGGSLLRAFHPSFSGFDVGLLGFGIGYGFDAVGLFALLGLSLFELPLGSE